MKNPPPPATLTLDAWHILPVGTQLWRIMFAADPHATPFGQLRHWGPTRSRWDPQRGKSTRAGEPTGAIDADRGVLYAGMDVATAFAEVYQDEAGHRDANLPRIADITAGNATLQTWKTIHRDLHLLDMTGDWALRHGASYSLASADRALCRQWARTLLAQHPTLDGLWVRSTMNGRTMPVLFTSSADTFPCHPLSSRLLTDPAIRPYIEAAARTCGYLIASS